jgi:hypothetical protein
MYADMLFNHEWDKQVFEYVLECFITEAPLDDDWYFSSHEAAS